MKIKIISDELYPFFSVIEDKYAGNEAEVSEADAKRIEAVMDAFWAVQSELQHAFSNKKLPEQKGTRRMNQTRPINLSANPATVLKNYLFSIGVKIPPNGLKQIEAMRRHCARKISTRKEPRG